MNPIESYILKHNDAKRELLLFFHDLFVNEYKLKPKINYGIPFYYGNKWVVYLNPDKREGLELAFPNAHLFDTEYPLLESRGRKMVKSVDFVSIAEIPVKRIRQIIQSAIEVDLSHAKK